MVTNNSIHEEILDCISNSGHFKELVLTPNGELFIDPGRTIKADSFCLYYKPAIYLDGSLYTNCVGESCSCGTELSEEISFSIMKNKTTLTPISEGGVQLFSRNGGIPKGSSFTAFFRYSGKVVWIIAGDAVNHRSYTILMDDTEEFTTVLFCKFADRLRQLDPEAFQYFLPSQDTAPVECIISTTESIVS